MTIEVTLPKAVQEQADASEALIEQAAQARHEMLSEIPPSEFNPVPDGQVPTPPAVDPQQSAAPPFAEKVVVPPAPNEMVSKEEYERLRQQFNTLQGRYLSADASAKELSSRMQSLESQPVPPKPEGPAYMEYVKPEEVEEIGEDVVELQGRIARGEASKQVGEAFGRLERRLVALEHEKATQTSTSLWDRVDDLAPGAKALNGPPVDLGWSQFLDGIDELSGKPRRDLGVTAAHIGDVTRLVSFVQEYQAASGQPQRNPVAPQQKPETVTSAPPTPQQTQGPTIRTSEITAFYNAWTNGEYKGREEEALAKEKQIDQAAREGRVIRDNAAPQGF